MSFSLTRVLVTFCCFACHMAHPGNPPMNDLSSLHLEPQILAQAFKDATPEMRKRGRLPRSRGTLSCITRPGPHVLLHFLGTIEREIDKLTLALYVVQPKYIIRWQNIIMEHATGIKITLEVFWY